MATDRAGRTAKRLTRAQFQEMLRQGRKLVWAGLYERQDYMVQIGPNDQRPVRDVTNEPAQHGRRLIGR